MSALPALPAHLQVLRGHAGAVLSAIATYERLSFIDAWGIDVSSAKRDHALDTINARMVQACDHIGITAREKAQLTTLIEAQRAQLAVLALTIVDLRHRTP